MQGISKAEHVEITDDIREKIIEYIDKTGLGPSALLRGDRAARPPKLTANTIDRWRSGAAKTAYKSHIEYAFAKWETMLANGQCLIELTPERVSLLQAERNRTQVSARSLLRMFDDWPERFDERSISLMLTGGRKTIPRMYYESLLEKLRSLPSASSTPVAPKISKSQELPSDIRDKIEYLHRRMRVGYYEIDGEKISFPNFITSRTQKLTPEDIEAVCYLFDNLKGTPPRKTRKKAKGPRKPELVALTYELRMALYDHIMRTLVPPGDILKSDPNAPEKLNAATIGYWINGTRLSAPDEHLRYIFEKYRVLPEYPVPCRK